MMLVTTAGKVGSPAARLLAQRQVPVRVLVRDPEKARGLADAGVEIAVGDLDDPESIDQAMAAMTMPPETSTIGREMPKNRSRAEPTRSTTIRNSAVLMAMRRAREW